MKKLWNFLKTYVIDYAAKPVLEQGGEFLALNLENYYAKDPKACASLVSGLYPFIDTIVEDAAARSETKYDYQAVAEIKKELEEFAAKHGFVLTNLDED